MDIDDQHQQILVQLTGFFPQLTEQVKPLLQTVKLFRREMRFSGLV